MLKKRNCVAAISLAAVLIALDFSQACATNITACGTFGAGSYVVVNNISSSGINCLVFNAAPVTLDLNGFTISGSGFTNGVLAIFLANVTVRNGTVTGFARSVNLGKTTGGVVDRVRALNGTGTNGISVGDNSTVENCLVSGHNSGGIIAGKNATIIGNTLSDNSGELIIVSDGSVVRNNAMTHPGTAPSGGIAIEVTQDCRVMDNAITTASFGISASGPHNVISGNIIRNTGGAISAGDNAVITGNNVSRNIGGIGAGADCLISGNNVSNNSGGGITGGARTEFLSNVSNENNGIGIDAAVNSSLIGNIADGNSSGFDVTCPSKVADNTALGNTVHNLNETGIGCLNTNNLAP